MCITAFQSFEPSQSKYKFVLLFNRDESLTRSTLPLQLWKSNSEPNSPVIVSGLDGKLSTPTLEHQGLAEGVKIYSKAGTWLGFNNFGKFGLLTNITQDVKNTAFQTRGELITNFLNDNSWDINQYLNQIEVDKYDGFNLVLGDLHSCKGRYLCNDKLDKSFQGDLDFTELNVISNVPFQKQPVHKIMDLKQKFQKVVNKNQGFEVEHLLAIMGPDNHTDPSKIQTGKDLLNHIFIPKLLNPLSNNDLYGTRTTTLATLTFHQELELKEFSWGQSSYQKEVEIKLAIKL